MRLGLKLQNIHHVLEFNQSQWLKPCIEFNTQKIIETKKNGDKDGEVLYKLMNNVIYRKTMENSRKRIDVRLVNNEKDYLKSTSKPRCISQKIFDNNLVAIRTSKIASKLNKPASTEIYIFELSKILMYD